MKKLLVAVSATLLVSAVGFAQENPFHATNERGETVHVLPTPAAADRAATPEVKGQPVDAPITGATVYRASYGAGNLLDHGGLEIANAGFFQIYYNSSPYNAFGSRINGFVNAFGSGVADYTIIQQYGSHATIAATLRNAGSLVDTNGTPSSISDTQVQSYIAGLFNAGRVTASVSTIYGVYLPQGTVSTSGSSSSCSNYCGYHGHFTYNGQQIKYAVFPFNDCSGCSLSGKTVGDMETIVTSHEIREAVTDPGDNNTNAWYDRAGYEADDKCAWHNLYQLQGTYWVQPEYSNQNKGCVVP